MKIALDPGHSGGSDPGAIGAETGIYESSIAWSVSVALGALLRAQGHTVHFTRDQIEGFASPGHRLEEAVFLANAFRVDLFLSIHCNAYYTPQPDGFEVWHYRGSRKGTAYAQGILDSLASFFPDMRNRGLKPSRGLYVLRETDMPAVLVELGFLSGIDEKRLKEGAAQADFARAIAAGIDF